MSVPNAFRVAVNGQSIALASLVYGAANVPTFADAGLGSQVTFPTTITTDCTFYIDGGWANLDLTLAASTTGGTALPNQSVRVSPNQQANVEYCTDIKTVAAEASTEGSAGASLTSTAASTQVLGDSATVGTGTHAARDDHKHAMPATPLPVASGGTAASSASAARTALSAAASGANADITSFTALSTPLTVAQGGTGAATLTGLVKGAGTSALGAATAETDYTSPAGSGKLTNKRVKKRVVALADAATVAINTDNGDDFTLLTTSGIGSTRAMGAPSGTPDEGDTIRIVITQDATGSRLLTWNAAFTFSSDLPTPTLSTGANKIDHVAFRYNTTVSKWQCIGLVRGF